MAAVAGIVKSVSSDVIAIDQNDHVRVLDVNDKVYIGEAIKGESESASITITANDGQDISINGYDTLWLDSSVVSDDIGESSIDTDALFKALLGNDYVSILDHINEKVDDILSATNLEQEEPNDEASVNISFNEKNLLSDTVYFLRQNDGFVVYTTDERTSVFGKIRNFQNAEDAYRNALKRLRAFKS